MKTLWTFVKRHPYSFIMICIGIIISIASANILPFILFGVFSEVKAWFWNGLREIPILKARRGKKKCKEGKRQKNLKSGFIPKGMNSAIASQLIVYLQEAVWDWGLTGTETEKTVRLMTW